MSEVTATVPSGSRWRRIALPASIILNLFLLAIIGGHVLHVRGARMGISGTPLARVLMRAEAVLPPKDAVAFGAALRRDGPMFAVSALKMREAREELERRIAADPFDPAATRQALTTTQKAWDRFVDDVGGSLVDALAQVSPEGRRKLVSETEMARTAPQEKAPTGQ